MTYTPSEIEPKWQNFWEKHRTFCSVIDHSKEKYYCLDMFPYPSGQGLHVGHLEGYTATDILSRYKRMKGYNVLHCMGWDAFGLPAEQYAIETGTHPADTTARNIANFKRQIKSLGFSYDWDREINTTDIKYYKWTQWIFLQLYKKNLAYEANAPVNWCPALKTVLANEEVIDGKSERGGHPVVRKPMRQWMLKITEYADKLLEGLDELDWPESIKEMQRNWIGKSHGAEIIFSIDGNETSFTVFTTRPDTLFGATYCVLSPEHPIIDAIVTNDKNKAAIDAYRKICTAKSDLERTDLSNEKTGVFTGAFAINPADNEKIPIWISDYVLMGYGTGAIMAVPAHDQRDYEFAKQFHLAIPQVIDGGSIEEEAYTGEGMLINSGFLNGLNVNNAKEKMISWLEEKKLGKRTVNYKMRDWLFSRQRYWGEPFPLFKTENEDVVPLSEDELPVTLPKVKNYQPSETGESPLSNIDDWINTTSANGIQVKRDSHTMPQWAGSCWYFLRFCDPHNDNQAWSSEAEKYWMPVDMYIGGAEHAVLHLLYARFWHKVLYDEGFVHTSEPFQKLINQGMILGEDGQKMSKSRGNVVNPDEVVGKYGADTIRLYEMFMGPLEKSKPWNMSGIEGIFRFLNRIWKLIVDDDGQRSSKITANVKMDIDKEKLLHQTIKKVTLDLENLRFNTAISKMMVFVNEMMKVESIQLDYIRTFVLLLSPLAPHIAEELWQKLGGEKTLAFEVWPTFEPTLAQESECLIPIQVNGKLRDTIFVQPGTEQEAILQLAQQNPKVEKYLAGKNIRKIIFVQDKILNIVVG